MKVIKKNKNKFTIEVTCQMVKDEYGFTYGKKDEFCGSMLEVNAEDIKKHPWRKYPDYEGVDYGVICPICGKFVVIEKMNIPLNVVNNAEEVKIHDTNRLDKEFNDEKEYYISHVNFIYPNEISQPVEKENYGILAKYMGKYFDRTEMDKIICELITRHPYVKNAYMLEIETEWRMDSARGRYHNLQFDNDSFEEQRRTKPTVKYEL